jgi:hypothetical protein
LSINGEPFLRCAAHHQTAKQIRALQRAPEFLIQCCLQQLHAYCIHITNLKLACYNFKNHFSLFIPY